MDAVQSCLSYRSNRVDKLLADVEEESQDNQTKVTQTIGSLRQLLDEQERVLLENVRQAERDDKQRIVDYKKLLQSEQQGLIEHILKFVVVCHDKNPKKLLDARQPFEDYIQRTGNRLVELRPLTRKKKHLQGLQTIKDLAAQIPNITLQNIPDVENTEIRQRINNNTTDKSLLNLSSMKLTHLDMEMVAKELEINRVSHSFCFLH